MITRERLAAYYQDRSETYARHVPMARERVQRFDRSSRFWRWFIGGTRWRSYLMSEWDTYSLLSEAYAVTARMLMGVDE